MLARGSLPQNLQRLWDTKGEEQLAVVRLNLAASRGNVEDLKVGRVLLPGGWVSWGRCAKGGKGVQRMRGGGVVVSRCGFGLSGRSKQAGHWDADRLVMIWEVMTLF